MCYCTCNQEPGTQALLYRRALLKNKEHDQTLVNDSSAEAQQFNCKPLGPPAHVRWRAASLLAASSFRDCHCFACVNTNVLVCMPSTTDKLLRNSMLVTKCKHASQFCASVNTHNLEGT